MPMVFILAAQLALTTTSEEYYNVGMSLCQKAHYGQSIQCYQAAVQLDLSEYYNWITFEPRTDLGLFNIAKTEADSSGYSTKNFTMGLFVGYMF